MGMSLLRAPPDVRDNSRAAAIKGAVSAIAISQAAINRTTISQATVSQTTVNRETLRTG
jgi:hypothetical protein